MSRVLENNKVIISGEIISGFEFSHEIFREKFYTAKLSSERLSGIVDTIPIMVSERSVSVDEEWMGQYVNVIGQLRSFNKKGDDKIHLILSVFAMNFEPIDKNSFTEFKNSFCIDGHICKFPNCRKTPLGREISDILLASNRPYGKVDYIPCIAWGRNAVFASSLDVGTHIKIEGRLQSREYIKKFEDGTQEMRTAYEASISKMEVLEETED